MKATSIARRLKQARSAWELSVEELASRAGVAAARVRTAESSGKIDLASLASMVGALGGTVDDLIEGKPFWTAPALALKSAGLADRGAVRMGLMRAAIAARQRNALARLMALDETWNATGRTVGPTAVVGNPAEHAEVLAGALRTLLGLGDDPIVSIRDVMSGLGVASFLTAFSDESVDGAMWKNRDEPPFVAVNSLARGGRVTAMRFTLAHELCHVLYDRPKARDIGKVEARQVSEDRLERRANAFAAYLLAPKASVGRFLRSKGLKHNDKPSAQHLLMSSGHFGMGVESMAWHFVSCNYWQRVDVHRHRSLHSSHFASSDDRELRASPAEQVVPLERRGELLDLATEALGSGLISLARWREIVGVAAESDWRGLLRERHVTIDGENIGFDFSKEVSGAQSPP